MYRVIIASVATSRARLFTFERFADHEGARERIAELGNFDKAVVIRANPDEADANFARLVMQEVADLTQLSSPQRVVLCASPRMLVMLREACDELPREIAVDHVPYALLELTPAELREQLACYGLLPRRESGLRRARGR
jgi:protein required for attachment to host cells